MPRLIGMIPARLGSKRVPKKNLRLIDGKPLISYIIETALRTRVLDEIYLNSEAEIFGEIAAEYGIRFYRRPERHSSDDSTNDEFAYDFMQNVPGDILIQLLPTSPLIEPSDIEGFVHGMLDGNYETFISVESKQIACLYNQQPINFERLKENPPSQTMTPVQAYATVLMGWHYGRFAANMRSYGSAYHGGDGTIGTYELRGLATLDIDREEDFQLADTILSSRNRRAGDAPPAYYGDSSAEHAEVDVASILMRDGIANNDLVDVNKEVVHLPEILASYPPNQSWSKRIINTESNCMTLLCQQPGEGNRLHYHPNWNEWWYIVEGEWEWNIEGETRVVRAGDIVFMSKGRLHKITARGNQRAIRMAISRDDVVHVYPEAGSGSEPTSAEARSVR